MYTKNKIKAFTLVELIVVITILAILGTIAFISLQNYAKSARDSARISDMSKMKSSLELFHLDAGKYPNSTDTFNVEYSGVLAWSQGYFGNQTFKNTDKLDQVPLDPLTEKKYIYSVTNTKQEYEIAGIMETYEGGSLGSLINDNVYAGDRTATLKITGNYNGKILKIPFGGNVYVVAVPSIITSTGGTLDYIIENNYFAIDGYQNLPAQYDGGVYNIHGDSDKSFVDKDPANYLVYSGSLDILNQTDEEGKNKRAELVEKIQDAYAGTSLEQGQGIGEITDANTEDDKEVVGTAIVHNLLGGTITPVTSSNNGGSGGSVTPNPDPDPITITFVNPDNQTFTCDLCD